MYKGLICDMKKITPSLSSADLQKLHPKVKFWTKNQWKAAEENEKQRVSQGEKGHSRCAKGENVAMLFVEDENGNPVDGHRAKNMRKHAFSIFGSLLQRNKAPEKWMDGPREVHKEYEDEMVRVFSEFALCENHWKAHHMASAIYSSWRRNRTAKGQEKSKRVPDDSDNDGSDDESRKRLRGNGDVSTGESDSGNAVIAGDIGGRLQNVCESPSLWCPVIHAALEHSHSLAMSLA